MDLVSSAKTKVVVTMEHSAKVMCAAFGSSQYAKILYVRSCIHGFCCFLRLFQINSIYILERKVANKQLFILIQLNGSLTLSRRNSGVFLSYLHTQ